jgi:lactate dehydrogenase-like 2-hydroxyacid dehydrogenase
MIRAHLDGVLAWIMDESALIEALQTDGIRNAELDVFTKSVDSAHPPNYGGAT